MIFPSYSVLIPAYNAQDTMATLLDRIATIPAKPQAVIVINDGSTDNTAKIACEKNAIVIDIAQNQGKGNALKTGFNHFTSGDFGDFVLCLDADLQHAPESAIDFLKKTTAGNVKIIIGKRSMELFKMPILRLLSNRLTSYILSILTRQKIYDSQCGYRLIKKDVLTDLVLNENGFQLESEFIIECARKKHQISFVEIDTIYNKNGSNINHIQDTFKFIKLISRELLRKWSIKNAEKK